MAISDFRVFCFEKIFYELIKMKRYILIKVTIKNSDGTRDRYVIDSYWSQETEIFCEKVAEMVKKFVKELAGEAINSI